MKHIFWDDLLSSEETDEICEKLASLCLDKIENEDERRDISRALSCRDYVSLCSIPLDYASHSTSESGARRQISALWSKRRDLKLRDTRAEAESVFWSAERRCAETNSIFRAWSRGRLQFDPAVEGVLHSAQRKIDKVLGDVPELADLRLAFGPGATTSTKRRNANPRAKLSAKFACSGDLSPIAHKVIAEMPAWVPFGASDSVLVDVEIHAARLDFVPKNWKVDRSIGVEPLLNTMVQKGYGEFLKGRLKRFGIDVTDQSQNQRLALSGSIDGGLATLDLSSASDLISRGLVEHLLPPEWFSALSCAATSTIVDDRKKVYRLEKFSTMGNGFTFPLETLIFWALVRCCVERLDIACVTPEGDPQVSVYGDDIICPVAAVPLVLKVLDAVGFTVNRAKSFWDGPFRESCGADYLRGINIRPVFIKDRLRVSDLYVLHNFFARRGDQDSATAVLDHLDLKASLWGPDGYGDGHLITADYSLVPHRREDGWGGFTFETYTWKSRRSTRVLPGDHVLPSYTIYARYEHIEDPVPELPVVDLPVHSIKKELSQYARSFEATEDFLWCDAKGRLGVTYPGVEGYKRIKIYTLTP